jgi:predicted SprT family Zn-dependent metalloprotease
MRLAHYIAFLFYGAGVKAHGAEFKHVCDLVWIGQSEIQESQHGL